MTVIRDPVVSDQRVSLPANRPERVASLRLASSQRKNAGASAASDEGLPVGEGFDRDPAFEKSDVDRSSSSRSSNLTLEAVSEWLVLQDATIRAHCARVLVEDLAGIKAAAQAQGFAEGEAVGTRAAEEKAGSILGSLQQFANSAIEALESESVQLTEMCADIVTHAILKIAGPLLGTREAALGAVKEVLQRVKEEREITIRVNAADLDFLQSKEADLSTALGGRRFSLLPDLRVTTGGCIVEAKLGSLDGRLESQLRECCETLRVSKTAPTDAP